MHTYIYTITGAQYDALFGNFDSARLYNANRFIGYKFSKVSMLLNALCKS